MILNTVFLAVLAAASVQAAVLPPPVAHHVEPRQDDQSKLVFAHFMIGIVSNRHSASDYDSDMKLAKSLGVDAFALNIGVDDYTDQQLEYAYESAANNDMKAFLSIDFNWYKVDNPTAVGEQIAQFANKTAQLKIGGKVFASSFAGDGLDVAAMKNAAGIDVFWLPYFTPGKSDFGPLDGAFNWISWPNDGNNKAPKPGANVTVQAGDETYLNALGAKPFMAGASPWFFTHFGSEVDYSKNWVFPGGLLWFQRWFEILQEKPQFVEAITWNDYGESHYIGPLSSPHYDDGGSRWTNDYPHGGWFDMAKPFISAYKAGADSPNEYIKDDQIVYWYRAHPADIDCSATDNTMGPANNDSGNFFNGRPNGWETMPDEVYVVSLLTSAGTVTLNSAGTVYTFDAPAGAAAFAAPFKVGAQAFELTRDGQSVLKDTSLKEIKNECVCGMWNFNAYVGSVPAQPRDDLQPDGLNRFREGLKVDCQPSPSLPATPPATQAPTTTISVSAAPTGPV